MSLNVGAALFASNNNPLINPPDLPFGAPALDRLKNEHYLPALRYGIEKAKKQIVTIRDNPGPSTFENTVEALEFAGQELERITAVFSNIRASNTNDVIRSIEEPFDTEVTHYSNDIFLDSKLFARVQAVHNDKDRLPLTGEQLMLLENTYKGFVRSGANLPEEQKTRLRAINEELSVLTTRFENNKVKAAEAYQRIITDEAELDGVPERAKNIYRAAAKEAGLTDGVFLITLEPYPRDIFTHCTNRALREEIGRADENMCYRDKFDNTGLILDIVRLRHESAQLMGYATYADYILSDRMAGSVEKVHSFLEKNFAVYKPAADAELRELRDFALKTDGLSDLKSWDVGYYSRLLKEQKFDFQTEMLRPYFDLEKVLDGVRQHAEKLFNIEMREEKSGKYPVYHPDVKTYEVFDKSTGALIGLFYGDYYACKGNKRSGAWCDVFRKKGLSNGVDQIPIVTNNCNFAKPTPEQPTLLTLGDVETIFHESGHAFHELLAEGRYPSLTGTNVKWDFVELPSQLMENWVCEPKVLAGFARHYQTGEVLPAELIQKMKDSKNFHVAWAGLSQTFLALLDMAYYAADPATITSVEDVEAPIADRALLLKREDGPLSVHFAHIFSRDYSAGYYCYKWAEGMEAHVFSKFQERGLYDPELRDQLRNTIFAKGGSVEPMELYVQMMGCEPDPDALFRREGLLPPPPSPQQAIRQPLNVTPA